MALAFDASHQGESEGLPRCLEDPFSRVEDIRSAVDYLVTLPYVDEERIGAMGVCAGGGYTMSAIQTDVRIKAAAGISTWDVGDSARNGFPGVEIENFMQKLLQEVARARTAAARGEEAPCWKYVPDGPDEIDEHTSVIQREAYEYYRTPRCSYPTSVNRYLVSSNDKLAAFDAFAYLDTVSPRPLLFIVGSRADTLYFTEDAYRRAREPKKIHVVEGASHVDLYDKPEYVTQVVEALKEFFARRCRHIPFSCCRRAALAGLSPPAARRRRRTDRVLPSCVLSAGWPEFRAAERTHPGFCAARESLQREKRRSARPLYTRGRAFRHTGEPVSGFCRKSSR